MPRLPILKSVTWTKRKERGNVRGKKAKQIRKKVYGDFSFRLRDYRTDNDGVITANPRRQAYQNAKKVFGKGVTLK